MLDRVMWWLWGFLPVRVSVFYWFVKEKPGHQWLAANSPLLWVMRARYLEAGDLRAAAACTEALRAAGRL